MKKPSLFKRLLLVLALCLPLLKGTAQTLPLHLENGAGSFRLGVIVDSESRWLDQCTIRQKGVTYTVEDRLWKDGTIQLIICPLVHGRGFIVEISGERLPEDLQLCWAFGGCDGSARATITDNLIPTAASFHNVHSIEGNAFTTYYGASMRLRVTQGVAPLDSELRLADGHQQSSPLTLYHSGKKTDAPVIAALTPWKRGEKCYISIYQRADYNYYMLPEVFEEAYQHAKR